MRVTAIITVLPFLFTTPGAAQDTRMPQEQPGGPNSGAGIPGQQGNKNGPAARPPSATSGAGASSPSATQDASKIPGQPGNKSGPPAAKPQPGAGK